MALLYKNQNERVKEFRAWARQNGYVMRKCNVLFGGSKAYKLYDKTNNKVMSGYFTLNDITKINNYCSEGFDYLIG